MKTHEIKLLEKFCDDVYFGTKTFEIRKDDRDYQVGDFIHFIPIDCPGNQIHHKIENKVYKITYKLSGWGLKDGCAALGIQPVD